jgi:hypothetical protein
MSSDVSVSQNTKKWFHIMLLKMFQAILNDESGVIVSAELVLVLTIAVLAMVVGLSEVAVAVNTELNDVSNAFGALNQSYVITGFHGWGGWKLKSFVAGTSWYDVVDDCDFNYSCDLVCGAGLSSWGETGGFGGVGGGW